MLYLRRCYFYIDIYMFVFEYINSHRYIGIKIEIQVYIHIQIDINKQIDIMIDKTRVGCKWRWASETNEKGLSLSLSLSLSREEAVVKRKGGQTSETIHFTKLMEKDNQSLSCVFVHSNYGGGPLTAYSSLKKDVLLGEAFQGKILELKMNVLAYVSICIRA